MRGDGDTSVKLLDFGIATTSAAGMDAS